MRKMNPDVNILKQLVIFALDGHRFALRLSLIRRIIHAVEVTIFPGAPQIVAGLINLQGEIIPVLDLRQRLQRRSRPVRLTDHFIIVHTSKRVLALHVDSLEGVVNVDAEMLMASGRFLSETSSIEGVVKLADGLVVVEDLETFLSTDQEKALTAALLHTER